MHNRDENKWKKNQFAKYTGGYIPHAQQHQRRSSSRKDTGKYRYQLLDKQNF